MKFRILLLAILLSSALFADTSVFLFYINGDNSFESDAISLLNQLESVQLSDSITVIAQMDRISGYDTSNSDWVNTRRYLITQDNDTSVIGSQFLSDLGENNMADSQVLQDYLSWAVNEYPADNYHLIMWDHTTAWELNDTSPHRTVMFDSTNNSFMTTPDVAEAIEVSGAAIDLIVLDMDYKGTFETLFELRDVGNYIASSQNELENRMFYYVDMLSAISQTDDISTEILGENLINGSNANNNGAEFSISLVKSNQLNEMKNLINEFVSIYDANQEWDVINNAVTDSKMEDVKNYIDIGNFINELNNNFTSGIVNQKVTALITEMDSLIVISEQGGIANNNTGLSIFMYDYYMTDWMKYGYPWCDFAARSYWKAFIETRLANTSFKSFNCGFESELSAFWKIENGNDDDFFWELGALNSDSHNGERCAAISNTPGNEDHDDWLILPKVYVEPGSRVSFWARSATNSLSDIVVYASYDDNVNTG